MVYLFLYSQVACWSLVEILLFDIAIKRQLVLNPLSFMSIHFTGFISGCRFGFFIANLTMTSIKTSTTKKEGSY